MTKATYALPLNKSLADLASRARQYHYVVIVALLGYGRSASIGLGVQVIIVKLDQGQVRLSEATSLCTFEAAITRLKTAGFNDEGELI